MSKSHVTNDQDSKEMSISVLPSSLDYSMAPSPLSENKIRITFKIPIPAQLFDSTSNSINDSSDIDKDIIDNGIKIYFGKLLLHPIHCQGSAFQLYPLEADSESFPNNNNSSKLQTSRSKTQPSNSVHNNGPKNRYKYVFTDLLSPKPSITADAISIRLQKRLQNFWDESSIDGNVMELCAVS